jgi:hypothetical protein
MADVIQSIYLNPPIAIARLGGSSIPQDAYVWVQSPNPRTQATTTIAPAWSLRVDTQGRVTPTLPDTLKFRDGRLIRPVCPFFEVWARVGKRGSRQASWRDVPLTPRLLKRFGATPAALTVEVEAKNFKAARRTGNGDLEFGTFPNVVVRGDYHARVPLRASSPRGASQPMIPRDRHIAMGFVQIMQTRPQPKRTRWADAVNVEILRFRFTPARGHSYGVPGTARPQPTPPPRRRVVPVEAGYDFLNAAAGWADSLVQDAPDAPDDTYDGADVHRDPAPNPSLGIVDDTCEVRFEVRLQMPGRRGRMLKASACAFVGPPDFAPDRRPFLSAADELNDRCADAGARTGSMTADERDRWVQDLFERIHETVSLLNVDNYRSQRAITLRERRLRPIIAGDTIPESRRAMGGRDAMRNRNYPLTGRDAEQPLPLSEHARMRHLELTDLTALKALITEDPERLPRLVRAPFEAESDETIDESSMRMPPFMRNSNAFPLTLSGWQYALLMDWVDAVKREARDIARAGEHVVKQAAARTGPGFSRRAKERHARVLERIAATGEDRD